MIVLIMGTVHYYVGINQITINTTIIFINKRQYYCHCANENNFSWTKNLGQWNSFKTLYKSHRELIPI